MANESEEINSAHDLLSMPIVTVEQVSRFREAALSAVKNCDCICKGNWREIISESQSLFGQLFNDQDGKIYRFVGVLWGEDDYYYVMTRKGDWRLLSCVGGLDQFGFSPVLNQAQATK